MATFTVTASVATGSHQSAATGVVGNQARGTGAFAATSANGGADVSGNVAQSTWRRPSGSDRYEAMSAIVGAGSAQSDWAVLATDASFPDALTASSLAGARSCPVLLTDGQTLSSQAHHQLECLGVGSVYLMGGEASISTTYIA